MATTFGCKISIDGPLMCNIAKACARLIANFSGVAGFNETCSIMYWREQRHAIENRMPKEDKDITPEDREEYQRICQLEKVAHAEWLRARQTWGAESREGDNLAHHAESMAEAFQTGEQNPEIYLSRRFCGPTCPPTPYLEIVEFERAAKKAGICFNRWTPADRKCD